MFEQRENFSLCSKNTLKIMLIHDIIIKPIISEKSLKAAGEGYFTFLVNTDANKTEIKKAIETAFSVNVKKIKTNTTKGSVTRNTKVGRKVSTFANKKAFVKLSNGQTIDIFEEHLGGGKEDKKEEKTKKETKAKKEVKKEEAKS